MEARRRYRCPFTAWIIGWATAVFATSALIAMFGPPHLHGAGADGAANLLAVTWRLADDMSPLAKLLFGGLFAGLCWAVSRLAITRGPVHLTLYAMAGIAAMVIDLLLIPERFSRGFGIGLTGARLDMAVLPFYLLGAVLAGVVFRLVAMRCTARATGKARG